MISEASIKGFPKTLCRFDVRGLSYDTTDYEITLERQTSGYAKIWTEEPIEVGVNGLLSLGVRDSLSPVSMFGVLHSYQVQDDLFESILIEPIHKILNANFFYQGLQVTWSEVYQRIAQKAGLSFVNLTEDDGTTKSVFLPYKVRNCLDQVHEIFGITENRWRIDLVNQRLQATPGFFDMEPVELPVELLLEEVENGAIFKTIPLLRPYVPAIWADEECIIDQCVFDGKKKTVTVVFEEKEYV
jgi:hypothetical protein